MSSSPDLFLRLAPAPCFLPNSAFLSSRSPTTVFHSKKKKKKMTSSTCLSYYKSPSAALLSPDNDIPKQFRAENLIDGLMDNYKNVPEFLFGNPSSQLDALMKEDNHFCQQSENLIDGLTDNLKNVPEYLYGLPSSQLDLFLKEANPFCRQSENLSEEILESYSELAGMDDMEIRTSLSDSSTSMAYDGRKDGGRRERRRRRNLDLPSRLLKARVCYLGLPIYTAVADLMVKQLMYMDFTDNKKPIYIYINSFGTQDEDSQLVGMETDAFAVADTMQRCVAPIYTINCGWADGQAAMLLSLGDKGKRAIMKNASARLHLPKAEESHGTSTDLWLRAEELECYSDVYLELLEKGTGRSREQLRKDIVEGKYFNAEKAVEYGLVDKVVDKISGYYYARPNEGIFSKRQRSGRMPAKRQGAIPGTRMPAALPRRGRPAADPVPA